MLRPVLLTLLLLGCDARPLAVPASAARLTLDADTLDLGPVAIGASASATLTITNDGDRGTPLHATLTGEDFALDSAGPWTVAPASSLTIRLRFSPVDGQPRSGALELLPDPDRVFDPSPLLVDLSGLVNADGDDDGHDHIAAGGDDCDDQDATVFPGATEVWYDGADQDCDGNDDDQDGDGSPLLEDCDDRDASVLPGGEDLDFDGADDDCDGLIDDDAARALEGQLVITEFFLESASLESPYGQYIELYNGADLALDPTGWTVTTEDGALEITADVDWEAGASLLLCGSQTPESNGGLDCQGTLRPWPDFDAESDGLLVEIPLLDLDGDVLETVTGDEIAWDRRWPRETGASVQLSASSLDADSNDHRDNWCLSTALRDNGDRGTPGASNETCP